MGTCGSNTDQQLEDKRIADFLKTVKNKVLVMSGKGGVGKSTVATNLAVMLSEKGYKVGLLDIDLHGPSIAGLLGLTGHKLNIVDSKIQPFPYSDKLKVMTVQGFLDQPDAPLIWRGPMKISAIRQFLADSDWGELDYLVIDSPPGTGDEPLTVAQTIPGCQAVVVTTPQEIALADVRKSIQFCHELAMPVLGIVENMAGFVCPECGSLHAIFKSGGGEKTAENMNIHFLGSLPIDPSVVADGDAGAAMKTMSRHTREAMGIVVQGVIEQLARTARQDADGTMKIAIPLAGEKLCAHFGHCEQFAFVTVNDGKVVQKETLTPPPHAPGVIPNWLADQGCTDVLVGGMGESAQAILRQRGVRVVGGIPSETPEALVASYLQGLLIDAGCACDHSHDHGHSCGNHSC